MGFGFYCFLPTFQFLTTREGGDSTAMSREKECSSFSRVNVWVVDIPVLYLRVVDDSHFIKNPEIESQIVSGEGLYGSSGIDAAASRVIPVDCQ